MTALKTSNKQAKAFVRKSEAPSKYLHDLLLLTFVVSSYMQDEVIRAYQALK